ncbi:MAG: Hsp20/alpha crystallin family protein [Desulfocapsaceae bacterium]|jgi:HSP20 family protein
MQLTTYTPRFGMKPYRNTLNLFEDFFAPFNQVFEPGNGNGLQPAVDIYEKDEMLLIEAELPGLEKEDIKVDVQGRLLTLGGEHVRDQESKENGNYRRERRIGRFERTFKLPFEVSDEQIEAVYKNGVLTLKVSKPEEQKVKQITIN